MDTLKQLFFEKSNQAKAELKDIVKNHSELKADEVNIGQIIGGSRGIKTMLWDTSSLDATEGIRFRGFNIPQLRDILPKPDGAREPLPEGLFWLMLTGEVPTEEQVKWLSGEWGRRASVDDSVYNVIDSMTVDTHPMTQFTVAVMAMQKDSIFAKRYDEGFNKDEYWDAMYEDTMNLIARLPLVASYIFRRIYGGDAKMNYDPNKDWAANYAALLGFDAPDFTDLMRLYLTIHADHEGGNASAHTVRLVGSTLSDAYLSFAAGMNALAGPLHGLANQEVIKWIFELTEKIGTNAPTKEQLRAYILETLESGQVVPGYGHAVLRQPDPRFMAQKSFAETYIQNDPTIQIVWDLFEIVPEILGDLGKVKNPWPNVDAHSGALLCHYGFTQYNYYTVLFGVSRALGVLAQLCWDRALGLALERPKSVTTPWIKSLINQNK
ncbi:MAG: citrate (Si)-synthase [Saprospiraceae bacterium]|nr:citrate (Si)-synthase [Saprospiraceae bacterium]